MRAIKFRGKSVDSGEWLIGCLTFYAGTYQVWEHTSERGTWNYIVIPETVGQFTGLLDKTGAEIYEGDIVELWGEFDEGTGQYHNSPVTFENGCFNITDPFEYGNQPVSISRWLEDGGHGLVVVGNIYENPELMEGGVPSANH